MQSVLGKDAKAAFLEGYIVQGAVAAENGDIAAYCPLHENPETSKKPSAVFNFDKDVWVCHAKSCQGKGRSAGLNALVNVLKSQGYKPIHPKVENGAPIDIKTRKPRVERPPVDEKMVADWEDALDADEERCNWLNEHRLITDETIEQRRIGWSNKFHRYTIPTYTPAGTLYNARMYSPDPAEGSAKIWWWNPGRKPELYGADLLGPDVERVWLFEGEWDALLAAQDGLPAVTGTAGAGEFSAAYGRWFAGREVVVVYDADDAGREGRRKATEVLKRSARAVYWVDLPDGMDYTDYRKQHPYKDFCALAERETEYPEWKPGGPALPETGEECNLAQSQMAQYSRKPLSLSLLLAGKVEPTYMAPRRVEVSCDQKKGSPCKACPMNELYDGETVRNYGPRDDIVRRTVDSTDQQRDKLIRAEIGAKCSDHLKIEPKEDWHIEQLFVTDSLDRHRDGGTMSKGTREMYVVGASGNTELNTQVRAIAENLPGKKDQRSELWGWKLDPVQTSIEKFSMTPELLKALRAFQSGDPKHDPVAPLTKCEEIAADLARCVTQIYERPLLHIAYDLVFHSVLELNLMRDELDKGWLEAAIVGDSRTGKTHTGIRLSNYYNAGIVNSCDNASLAGLLGGMQKIGSNDHWNHSWGVIPMNDRRLVILDESHNLVKHPEIIESMSSIRSSGLAEIHKIGGSNFTDARTRLIWLANPAGGNQLATYPRHGIDALRQLMPAHEDIARFDFAMAIGTEEVESEVINAYDEHPDSSERYPAELCEALVLWAWSRKRGQVTWFKDTERFLLDEASRLGHKYTSSFPLIQGENVREKIARIAAAFAARTFSTEDGETLIIRKMHVRSAVEFLSRIYSHELFPYEQMSVQSERDEAKADRSLDEVRNLISGKNKLWADTGPKIARALSTLEHPNIQDICNYFGLSSDEASRAIQWLEGRKMITFRGSGQRFTNIILKPQFVALLRELEDEED